MMNTQYKNSQTGWLMLVLFTLIPIQITVSYLRLGQAHVPTTVFVILLVLFIGLIITFYKLTVKADKECIHLIYGLGLVHIRIRPQAVTEVKIVNTPWYYGYGIRFTPKGMLYNIQGSSAVQMTYLDSKTTNGKLKTVMIGTNDASGLQKFLQQEYGLI
ncbi:MAG: hypothetical protein ABWY16_09435 [Pedobacter sp.]|uniref:hypothetical protein n=1 Tax=Pedobacter sp. TaxID=1411316 RepID=UPI0033937474